jgi:hypothetical protein
MSLEACTNRILGRLKALLLTSEKALQVAQYLLTLVHRACNSHQAGHPTNQLFEHFSISGRSYFL